MPFRGRRFRKYDGAWVSYGRRRFAMACEVVPYVRAAHGTYRGRSHLTSRCIVCRKWRAKEEVFNGVELFLYVHKGCRRKLTKELLLSKLQEKVLRLEFSGQTYPARKLLHALQGKGDEEKAVLEAARRGTPWKGMED